MPRSPRPRAYVGCYVDTAGTGNDEAPLFAGELQVGAKGWKHDVVKNNLGLLGRSQQDKAVYIAMNGLREEADYLPTTVAESQLTGRRQKVVDLVNELVK